VIAIVTAPFDRDDTEEEPEPLPEELQEAVKRTTRATDDDDDDGDTECLRCEGYGLASEVLGGVIRRIPFRSLSGR
jgi:hypothetical protein